MTEPDANLKPLAVKMRKAKHLLDMGKDKLTDLIKDGKLDSFVDEDGCRKITMESIERHVAKQVAAQPAPLRTDEMRALRLRGRRRSRATAGEPAA